MSNDKRNLTGASAVTDAATKSKLPSIIELATELERQQKTSRDFVAPTNAIKAVELQAKDPNRNELNLDFGTFGKYGLTHHGSLQLADKCGIPRKYYEAMLAAGMVDLTAENVNRWIEKQSDKRLIRVLDNRVRAILSDRYRVLDNHDLAMLTMTRAKEHNAQVQECQLTETRMYIKLVVPGYEQTLRESAKYRQGTHDRLAIEEADPVIPGLIVSNSEVGDGAFRVEPFVFRLVCSNGLIGTTSLYRIHLGRELSIGEQILKDDTRKAIDVALWGQVRDTIDATFDGKILTALVKRLKDAKEIHIDKPQEVVDVAARDLALSDEKKLDLLRYFGTDTTQFGFVNAITRLAQDFNNYDDKIRLERHAGELLCAPAARTA